LPPAAATRTSTSVSYRVLAAVVLRADTRKRVETMCIYLSIVVVSVCTCVGLLLLCVFVALYVFVCGVSSVLLVATVFAVTIC
jgi:hypothetical protein